MCDNEHGSIAIQTSISDESNTNTRTKQSKASPPPQHSDRRRRKKKTKEKQEATEELTLLLPDSGSTACPFLSPRTLRDALSPPSNSTSTKRETKQEETTNTGCRCRSDRKSNMCRGVEQRRFGWQHVRNSNNPPTSVATMVASTEYSSLPSSALLIKRNMPFAHTFVSCALVPSTWVVSPSPRAAHTRHVPFFGVTQEERTRPNLT